MSKLCIQGTFRVLVDTEKTNIEEVMDYLSFNVETENKEVVEIEDAEVLEDYHFVDASNFNSNSI